MPESNLRHTAAMAIALPRARIHWPRLSPAGQAMKAREESLPLWLAEIDRVLIAIGPEVEALVAAGDVAGWRAVVETARCELAAHEGEMEGRGKPHAIDTSFRG